MNYINLLFIIIIILRKIRYYSIDGIQELIRMYKSTNTYNYVAVNINAGLGNRLMSLAGLIVLSIFYKSKPICILKLYIFYTCLVINWEEFKLFYRFSNYNITTTILKRVKYKKICPFNKEIFDTIQDIKNFTFDIIWCDLLYEMINNSKFKRNIHQYIYRNKRINSINYIFYIYYIIFTKVVVVNKHITNSVLNFQKSHNYYQYYGMQIRVGNEDLKEKQFLFENDTDMLLKIIKSNNKYKKWFLTGDSQQLKLNFSKTYPNIFVYTTHKAKHYAFNKKDSTIIIEHELLSKSNQLYISKSTFGLTAALKSGLLINTNHNLCYEIKNGKLYNIQDEFTRFVK